MKFSYRNCLQNGGDESQRKKMMSTKEPPVNIHTHVLPAYMQNALDGL